jgi:hypothetical protein
MRIIDIRSKTMADVPGGATGLLVGKYKGRNRKVSVYRADTALMSQLRDALRQAGEEMGQLSRRRRGRPPKFPIGAAP